MLLTMLFFIITRKRYNIYNIRASNSFMFIGYCIKQKLESEKVKEINYYQKFVLSIHVKCLILKIMS